MGKQKYKNFKKYKAYKGFFAYSSNEKVQAEIIETAIKQINESKSKLIINSWKHLDRKSSRIISNILDHIEKSDYLLADLTGLNPNVLFEVGYAFGKRKSLLLFIQGNSEQKRKEDLEKIEMLSCFSITPIQNVQDLMDTIKRNGPDKSQFKADIEMFGIDLQQISNSALFLKGLTNSEIALEAIKVFRSKFSQVKIDDWTEDRAQRLTWYIQEIVRSSYIAALFVDFSWDNSIEVNARFSFLCGLAVSLEKNVQMIGLPGFKSPFDYKDILKYAVDNTSVRRIIDQISISDLEQQVTNDLLLPKQTKNNPIRQQKIDLSKDDKEIIILDLIIGDIGNPVAELEEKELSEYFIRTAQFEEALKGRQCLFIGSKGTGKTANFLQLCTELKNDRRNIVCDIKPSDYKLSRFLSALKKVSDPFSGAVHIAENAWKLIGFCEIVLAINLHISSRPLSTGRSKDEQALEEFWAKNKTLITSPFETKLEIVAHWLESTGFNQDNFSELVHKSFIFEAKKIIKPILDKDTKIYLVFDNLDKAWDKEQDLSLQSLTVFALLGLGRRIENELGLGNNIHLIIFLRRNIFEYILKDSREQDKLLSQCMQMVWNNEKVFLNVIEKRFQVAFERNNIQYINIWDNLFPLFMDGISTKKWIINNVLPKPRDLIRFTQFVMEKAFSHNEITCEDLKSAQKIYSAFAINQIIAEYQEEYPWISPLIFSFSGLPSIINLKSLEKYLKTIKLYEQYNLTNREMINQLIRVGFLGVLLNESDMRFAASIEDGILLEEKIKNHPINRTLLLIVHPVFCSHLGICEVTDKSKINRLLELAFQKIRISFIKKETG